MVNEDHLKILEQGVDAWNEWREENPEIRPVLDEENLSGKFLVQANFRETSLAGIDLTYADLRGADFTGAFLQQADLRRANLSMAFLTESDLSEALLSESEISRAFLGKAHLDNAILDHTNLGGSFFTEANLYRANLACSDLSDANFWGSNLSESNLTNANLYRTDLSLTNLYKVNFTGAKIIEANFNRAIFVETILSEATLQNCNVYGISAWKVQSDTIKKQTNLRVSPENEPIITVDNLEVAQFIYLLLNNKKIRHVIDTITSKVVLILGRFTEIRKDVLDAIREELRKHDYLPILFDFEKPSSRNLTETISTLAHMARFVIADLTDAKSIPHELQRIIPDLPSVPVQPVILSTQYEYAMFKDFFDYQSVLTLYRYDDLDDLLSTLHEKVIKPAIDKAEEIQKRRNAIERQLADRQEVPETL